MSKKKRTKRKSIFNRKPERELPVFVYGTLLPGFHNYEWHLEGKTLKEEKATMQGEMYDFQGYYPVVDVTKPGSIKGKVMYIRPEIYQRVLADMDALEGYEPGGMLNLYNRVTVKAETEDGSIVECYTYSMGNMFKVDNSSLPAIESGDWAEFTGRGLPTVLINKLTMKFSSKRAVITQGANELLDTEQMTTLLNRHYSGDWGVCEEDSVEINNKGLESGEDSMLSIFKFEGNVFWVYTEWDRSATTILLPSEW